MFIVPVHLFSFRQLQATYIWISHTSPSKQEHLWQLLAFKVLIKDFLPMTNQITPFSSLCNKAWGKHFFKPVAFTPAMYDHKLINNNIIIYTQLALQRTKNKYIHRDRTLRTVSSYLVKQLLCPTVIIYSMYQWEQAAKHLQICDLNWL